MNARSDPSRIPRLAALLTIALLGKKLSPRAAGTIGTLAIALAFVFAVLTLI